MVVLLFIFLMKKQDFLSHRETKTRLLLSVLSIMNIYILNNKGFWIIEVPITEVLLWFSFLHLQRIFMILVSQ